MSETLVQSRYSCQVALPGFGSRGQEKLGSGRVLIAGVGGLGCPAAQYLVSSGVGTIGLADFDTVSVSNLHRQILFGPADVGRPKTVVAAEKLSAQNPAIKLQRHEAKITSQNVEALIEGYDIILDCTDNFDSRYLLNDAAVLAGKPLVYGAIYQYEGQVAVWNLLNDDGSRSPNYRDLFPEVDASQIPNCSEGGVIPTLAGIIGCMQANEAIKYLTGSTDILASKLLLFDAQTMRSRVIKTAFQSKVKINGLVNTQAISQVSVHTLLLDLQYTLVDVREEMERSTDHIGGLHIPLKELAVRLEEIPTEKNILFYCASGKRSEEAAKIFSEKNKGVNVFSLQGGLQAFREKFPL